MRKIPVSKPDIITINNILKTFIIMNEKNETVEPKNVHTEIFMFLEGMRKEFRMPIGTLCKESHIATTTYYNLKKGSMSV